MADINGRGSDLAGPYVPTPLQLMLNSLEKPLSRYPTQEDAAFARQQGFDYAHPHKEFLDEKAANIYKPTALPDFIQQSRATGKPEIPNVTLNSPTPFSMGDAHMRAALAAKRSALAQLGIDPAKTVLDFSNRRRYVNGVPTAGTYVPVTGQSYVRATDFPEGDADPVSTIVHEAIHRGTHKLVNSPYWKPEWNDLAVTEKGHGQNEYLVRWLMQNKMGNPEASGPVGSAPDAQKKNAERLFGIPAYQKQLEAMEAAAAQMLKDKNPRGPR